MIELKEIVQEYWPLKFAMAYGSAVFSQKDYSKDDKPMIDLVFGVSDAYSFHMLNMDKHPQDYSLFARMIGVEGVSFLQHTGGKIYYNPFVKFGGSEIKYGVISIDDLVMDLIEWNNLYIPGRMHKPVMKLESDEEVDRAMKRNLTNAVHVACLLLPESFSEEEFYITIAGISYMGDSRMNSFENPKKIVNIVESNFDGFRELYDPIETDFLVRLPFGIMAQDKDPTTQKVLFRTLPQGLLSAITGDVNFEDSDTIKSAIKGSISRIVYRSSIVQTIKGFFSSGVGKSYRYVSEKYRKRKKH